MSTRCTIPSNGGVRESPWCSTTGESAWAKSSPLVEAYASSEARSAFQHLRELVGEAKTDPLLADSITEVRLQKEAAIDEMDFPRAAKLRDEEKAAMAAGVDKLGIDLDDLAKRAEQLIDTARGSVRGDV